jgi:type II restriction/modification system DNA methylase subunit YeeA
MNTKNLKAYAPKARRQFIDAVTKRAAHLGIYQHKVEPVQFEGGAALIEGRVFSRKQGEQRQQLEKRVAAKGYELFLREMAYTWFNRFAAIRYMEIHDYLEHGFRVLSHPTNPDNLPEILGHASDVADLLELDKSHIIELQLAGDKEEDLYRELLLGQCHHLYKIMPFMFEALDDATELLLPDNLTKTDSILKDLVNDIPEEDWQQIEVIGWLYQFYISEHKDAVIGKVIKSEDIPAATQLFTPNWIVKYMVQNSVGRQWLATYPESELKGKMEYYIEPAEQTLEVIEQLKAITPTSIDPEQIKVLDPAAGSGHILVEVYEVLREIYLERGYRLREIPELILNKNIYGLDIDDRAAQLAGFALMMKAREDDRRIFQRVQDGDVALNVYSLQSSEGLDIDKLWAALDLEGIQQTGTTGGLFDEPNDVIPAQAGTYADYLQLLNYLKTSFLQAKTLGSLIQVEQKKLALLQNLKQILTEKVQGTDPAAKNAAVAILPIVGQSIVLAQQYDAVVANPPYMGGKGMNAELKNFAKKNFPNSKSDLFSIYIEKCLMFGNSNSEIGMVTPYVWMFLSSHENLRKNCLSNNTLNSLVQLEYNAFAPACIPVCTFIISKHHIKNYVGSYIRLSEFKGHENQAPRTLEAINNRDCDWFFDAQPDAFKLIPGSPIAYWLGTRVREIFVEGKSLGSLVQSREGLHTANNDHFLKRWHEVSQTICGFGFGSRAAARESGKRWFPCNKGGDFRRWYGNHDYLVNWEGDGQAMRAFGTENGGKQRSIIPSQQHYFKPSVSWSDITSGPIAFRMFEEGFIHESKGMSAFSFETVSQALLASFCNTPIVTAFSRAINPTLSFKSGNFATIPFVESIGCSLASEVEPLVTHLFRLSKDDWNSYERSWDFQSLPLISASIATTLTIESCYTEWTGKSHDTITEMKRLEERNNSLFINAYGLADELTPKVPIEQITLTVNPAYRYGSKLTEDELWRRFREDSFQELVSYSIGCMMGRYSLDRKGLIYADSGNAGFKELAIEGAYQTFPADDDGIIPLASEDWIFEDDATTRFREFVLTVWDKEHLNENLEFVAESLCLHALKPKKGEGAMDTIRRYFSTQFFKDHCKTYKKRPIYWLFSSGKEKAFECLVYLHRYNEGTLSRMRTEYVTPLMGKYDHQHSSLEQDILEGSTEQKRLAEKALKDLEKKQAELRSFDEQLKHYAEMRVSLDLDDGVKVNYGKFGNLLADVKNIHGKAVK